MPADALHDRWQQHAQRIRHETHYLFNTRWSFRQFAKMFEENKQLWDDGHHIYKWTLGMWGRDALMGIRREMDDQSGVINLRHLLYEIEARHEVMSRTRYMSQVRAETPQDTVEFLREQSKEWFPVQPAASGDPMGSHIDPASVRDDRQALERATEVAFDYAQKFVAHRTPLEALEIKISDIHGAIDSLEPAFLKYYNLLTAVGLVQAEPSVVYYWHKPFTYAWRPTK